MTNNIINCFDIIETISLEDNFDSYEFKFKSKIDTNKLSSLNEEIYNSFNQNAIKYGYAWSLEIEENNLTIDQSKFIQIDPDDFDDCDTISVTLKIFKKGQYVVIINEVKFLDTIYNIGIEGILKIFKTKYSNGIIFINSKSVQLSSTYIGYNNDLKTSEEEIEKEVISTQCNFKNYSDLKFNPTEFNLGYVSKQDKIIELINKINQLYILIYISDQSEIMKNEIKIKISGLKTYECILAFNNLKTDSLEVYQKIYDWIYGEKNKIEDKIGIARNILSIYLKENDLSIDLNTFNSILSANKIYIKGNITKYIEARNKIHEQIEQISSKVNTTLEAFYNNFQKTIFVFISFYLTVFILKIYTKVDVESAINQEATVMGIGLITISFIFLWFSNWLLNIEKKRIVEKYNIIKRRALDLLVQDDIDLILNDDTEFKYEISFLERRRLIYIILWITTLVIFLIILFLTSSYI